MSEAERCCQCDLWTDRAGRMDDSLYCEDGSGPYCPECYETSGMTIRINALEAEITRLKEDLASANRHAMQWRRAYNGAVDEIREMQVNLVKLND